MPAKLLPSSTRLQARSEIRYIPRVSEFSSAALVEAPSACEGMNDQTIEIILKSRTFERATASRQLLAYLWTHQNEELSEYTLAVEALGRRPDFDPKIDATVRVQISRLRQRLHDFFQSYEAKLCPVVVTVPVGTHQLQITKRDTPVVPPTPAPEPNSEAQISVAPVVRTTKLTYLFGGLAVCLFIVILAMMAVQLRGTGTRNAEVRKPESQFWSGFLGQGKITRIILPTPTFFALNDANQQIRVRDLSVNDFSDWQKSEALRRIARNSPTGLKAEVSYMVASDTFAAISLARYLDRSDYGSEVQFGSSGSTSMDDLDRENEIIFGSYFTLHPFLSYTSYLTFQMEPFERAVKNNAPLPGEPNQLEEHVIESGHRSTQPGIIAVIPGKSPGFHLMVLEARHTSALVSFLTSSAGAEQLRTLWKQKGSPANYEVAVYSEMVDDHPIKTWPVLLHAIYPAK
jgi:hypothetical protein